MAYEYDFFLSYKNNNVTNYWVSKFVENLEYWLTQELGGKPPRFFFDKESIETGSKWPSKLQEGIKTSKCLICIWTPEYFRSKWCLSEWESFMEREKQKDGAELIIPVRFHDGESFPIEAQNRQSLDVRDFNYTVKSFWDGEKAEGLEDLIKKLSLDISRVIKSAPIFEPNFPIIIHQEEPDAPYPTSLRL